MHRVSADPGEKPRTRKGAGPPGDAGLIDAIVRQSATGPVAGQDDGARQGSPIGAAPTGIGRRDGGTVSVLPVATRRPPGVQPADPRISDVDEWGRSEHMRSVVRRFYDPIYRYWFRVEWEGLEKIPRQGARC